MVNFPPYIALGAIYIAENMVTLAELKLLAFLREEFDRAGCHFFCGVELYITMQRQSKVDQTLDLIQRITKPLMNINFKYFHSLLCPFLAEAH